MQPVYSQSRNRRRRRHHAQRAATPVWRAVAIAAGALLIVLGTCSAPFITRRMQQEAAPPPTPLPAAVAPAPTVAASATPRPTQIPQPSATPAPPPTPTLMAGAGPGAPPLSPLGREIDAYLSGLTSSGQFQGAVLVAQNGEVVIARGYGNADDNVPNTVQTRFRLASVTKQFTAAAILALQQDGKLTVDDAICAYLDPCPDAWKPLTIRHLLTHTSGLVDYTAFAGFEPTEMNPATPQELVERFRDFPLSFAPGTLYHYCNSNYVLLGLIIERVSGMEYADYLEQRFFVPLGMTNTGYDTSRGTIIDGAQGYVTPGRKSGFLDASTLYAAGGLYSTVGDLFRWDQALSTEEALTRTQLEQMFTPALRNYGFGWKIETIDGRRRISHPGNMTGVATFFARYPDDRATIIVLANMEYANAEGIANYVASRMFAPAATTTPPTTR
ncbi:serine hydrolase domain-containing protein [Roseiflexus castenholzii]|uniref:Serine-type D-Ala-D-Ala carboxypeptidase n=1 Tax=Roseiflexus castenholzii (strain DSM 13941 / HLO8) TaxID=383372 RepID=A7NF16_ROSCS|nr:serine hydrolase domain-containing protein [Roseiflexus castenholzii]ABU58291.1 Serine-type D-Ala-D-Ala carboxypeptidase [Roseiflexus castenholzii DSM 13941]